MKPETLVMKIIEAIETASPAVITFNGKNISITKKLIDKYKYCKVRDDIDLERIDANAKEGGYIFSLPLIFSGLIAAGTIAGAAAGGVGVANAKKAAIAEAAAKKATDEKNAAEERRHNLKMEKLAAEVEKPKTEKKGSGVGEMIGTMKEFGKSEETKKTVKQGLNKLEDSIDTGEIKVKHKGNGIFLKNKRTGEGIYLSKDDIDLERIEANAKEGGFLPFLLPLIFGGITAAIRITKTVLSKKADDAKAAEERTHNLALEKKA
ncbi:hypothetical protein LOTGIDRAFT_165371 [Lottia gigantea]|uniref:Uncharacterized protein n=1 Tax=Lottia gigantea TaxID=225164 RepID=V3ZC17_LOTGI|nr:hypothetical protein LOTGIDRAFT_165371 [Lottia gigantea]ESO88588.1 hypothetical protein LOTGIDRAFT_165371 [Lottia gigantea]